MKSYCLEKIRSIGDVRDALDRLLPGQREPWLLLQSPRDVIAYFHLGPTGEGSGDIGVQVDISGRHFYEDDRVIGVLRVLQGEVGGVILNDDRETV
jgi:hypothetical protein